MTTNQNRGERATAETGKCPCGAIAGHDGDCRRQMVYIREDELKALQLRVTSLEGALKHLIEVYDAMGAPRGPSRIMAEATLSPSGPQEA